MSEEQSPEQILAQQKEQCPFCKIISGEIPATKVYEDDKVVVICDINPLSPGHMLVLPREHYPLLPMIPEDVRHSMFEKVKYFSKAQKDVVVTESNSHFVASGGVAGQQAMHFLLHIIPAENETARFYKPPIKLESTQYNQLKESATKYLPQLIAQITHKPKKTEPEIGTEQKNQQKTQLNENQTEQTQMNTSEPDSERKKKLAQFIESNETIQQILKDKPDEFAKLIAEREDLKELFAGIDVYALSHKLKENEQSLSQIKDETKNDVEQQKHTVTPEQKKHVGSLLEENDELRNALIKNPDEFIQKIKGTKNEELFVGIDIHTLSQRLAEAYKDE